MADQATTEDNVTELRPDTGAKAAPEVGGVRDVFQQSIANRLDPKRLGFILSAVRQGDSFQYLLMAEELEERNLHYRSVLQTRKLAVQQLPWQIVPASDEARDLEIAEMVRELLNADQIDGLRGHLLDGLAKGWGVAEIDWKQDASAWVPRQYWHRPAQFFTCARETQQELRIRTDSAPLYGEEMPAFKFVCHTPRLKVGSLPRSGLAYAVAAYHVLRNFAIKDWAAFAEVFGMPIRTGTYNAGATEAEKKALLSALRKLSTDSVAIFRDGMKMAIEGWGPVSNGEFFEGMADWFNAEISKLVLGQTMTTEDGSSLAQAKVHADVRTDIRNADAIALDRTIDRDLIRPLVDFNVGPQEQYPRIVTDTAEAEDGAALAAALAPFMDRGLEVSAAEIYERLRLRQPDGPEDTIRIVPVDTGAEPPPE